VEIGKEEYHAEWTHDDTGKIVVYLLDKDMKKAVPIAAETLKISITTIAKDGGKTTVPYELAAVNRTTGDMPTASQFELTDKVLLGGLETLAPGGVEAELEVDINGKVYQAKITHDEHHHH
jgi:hypothetical protein